MVPEGMTLGHSGLSQGQSARVAPGPTDRLKPVPPYGRITGTEVKEPLAVLALRPTPDKGPPEELWN
jgi:hypothetical protein